MAAQKTGAVQLCFERELKRDPRVRGSATVTLELRAPRQLERVDVHDTLGRKTFTSCVAQAMRTIDLPSLTEDVSMQIPFALKAPEL
ncbi:MAG: AgmX/PglI C-terminal domain-containing protein [Deltaproteobacteria bacterium]|nr:AgmX/PglI C-terminal domain-containing protein [Deltaproteobacteria bacterium]